MVHLRFVINKLLPARREIACAVVSQHTCTGRHTRAHAHKEEDEDKEGKRKNRGSRIFDSPCPAPPLSSRLCFFFSIQAAEGSPHELHRWKLFFGTFAFLSCFFFAERQEALMTECESVGGLDGTLFGGVSSGLPVLTPLRAFAVLDGESLTLEVLYSLRDPSVKVFVSEEALERVRQSRDVVDHIVRDKKTVYGITTGSAFVCDSDAKKTKECSSSWFLSALWPVSGERAEREMG